MTHLLCLEGVAKSYGAVRAVDGVDLIVDPGEALGIIGPNGAGKSSLFNVIAGTTRPDSGRVILNGQDVTATRAAQRCQLGIGRTYQIPKPFGGMSVLENTMVAAQFGAGQSAAQAKASSLDILEQLELAPLADHPASSLRLLQRKRLEMARALASDPKLLLLDEIAGGLTDLECATLVSTIKSIQARGVAIIWIEHVVHALLAVVSRLAVINFGAKIAEGPPVETFESRDVQEIYLGIEA